MSYLIPLYPSSFGESWTLRVAADHFAGDSDSSVAGLVLFHESLKNHCVKHVSIIRVSFFSVTSLTSFFLEQEDNDVPKAILRLGMHGMSEILSVNTQDDGNLSDIDTPPCQSPLASVVLQLASTYQSKASDKRFHNKVRTASVGSHDGI